MNKTKTRRMKRYHKDVFFPGWADKSLIKFSEDVRSHGSISFSLHSLEKTTEYAFEYGRRFVKFLAKVVRADVFKVGNVFEFYAIDEEIKKACYRMNSVDSPVDLAIVISADGVVVTDFVISKADNHDTLDKSLYERS